jgi:hypothetical protein
MSAGKLVAVVGLFISLVLVGSAVWLELALRAAWRREYRAGPAATAKSRTEQPTPSGPAEQPSRDNTPRPNSNEEHADPSPAELENLVKNYILTKGLDNKLAYVMEPDKIRPLMEAFIRNNKGSTVVAVSTRFLGKRKEPVEWFLVRAKGETALSILGSADFPIRRTPQGYKIDWEAFVGYNSTPLKTFMIQRPKEPATFRVIGELADYYNYDFGDSKGTHYSIRLSQNNPSQSVHGYITKSSPGGKQLAQLLQDGRPHNLTVELQHTGPFGEPIEQASTRTVTITRLVGGSWVWK